MLTIRHLQLVRTLARSGHFGRAAEELGMSQPALSKGIGNIERILGVRIFDRSTPTTPTTFGAILISHSESIVADYSELLRELKLAKGLDTGSLSISCGLYPAEMSVQEAIGTLTTRHPSLLCKLMVKDWIDVPDDIGNRAFDIGIGDITEAASRPDLETEPLRISPVVIFCRSGHPLTRKTTVTVPDILEFPWACPALPARMFEGLPKLTKPFGILDETTNRVIPRIWVETFSAAKSVVLNGDALSAGPRQLIAGELDDASLTALPLSLPWLTLNYGFIWRRGRSLSPACLAFMQLVREIERRRGS
ncbi:LysR family transcriptional regulator [Aestuariivirga sp.]|uniref:LysR family transcriptional regulator n=1 Tax=Aestuariivirga sp. TaxID=2650926 RepID=UPI003BABBA62